MEKEITLKEFATDLKARIETGKTIDCCKPEIIRLADMAAAKMPAEKIRVEWKNN